MQSWALRWQAERCRVARGVPPGKAKLSIGLYFHPDVHQVEHLETLMTTITATG